MFFFKYYFSLRSKTNPQKAVDKERDEIKKFKKQCEEYIGTKEKEILDLQKKGKKELERYDSGNGKPL